MCVCATIKKIYILTQFFANCCYNTIPRDFNQSTDPFRKKYKTRGIIFSHGLHQKQNFLNFMLVTSHKTCLKPGKHLLLTHGK